MLADRLRGVFIHLAIQGNDAAERRRGIGLKRLFIGTRGVSCQRHATGIGMLHDDARGIIKALDALPCGVCISDVVVGQFFALQLLGGDQRTRRGVQVPVEGGSLVGVLAVTKVLQFHKAAV